MSEQQYDQLQSMLADHTYNYLSDEALTQLIANAVGITYDLAWRHICNRTK